LLRSFDVKKVYLRDAYAKANISAKNINNKTFGAI